MSSAWQLTLRMPLVKHNQLNSEATTISLIPIMIANNNRKNNNIQAWRFYQFLFITFIRHFYFSSTVEKNFPKFFINSKLNSTMRNLL